MLLISVSVGVAVGNPATGEVVRGVTGDAVTEVIGTAVGDAVTVEVETVGPRVDSVG